MQKSQQIDREKTQAPSCTVQHELLQRVDSLFTRYMVVGKAQHEIEQLHHDIIAYLDTEATNTVQI